MDLKCEKAFAKLPQYIQIKINNSNVFYSNNYRKYLSEGNNEIRFIYDKDFLIMASITKKYIFRYAQFPSENIQLNDSPMETEVEFLDKCIIFIKTKLKVQWLLITPASSFFKAYPRESKRIPFGNYVIDLSQTCEQIFDGFHSKHRNSVRKAEKSNVIVRCGNIELLEDYLILEKETWKRSGKSGQNLRFFRDLLDALGQNAIVFIAYKDEIPQGGAILIYNKEMSYYLFGASKNQPESGSMNLLHWEAIKYMKLVGVKKYSFVGCRIGENEDSKYHDIQRFKKRFGGELIEGYLFKAVFNTKYFNLFNELVRFKNGEKPYYDAIDQEIHKWRELQNNF